MTEHDWVQRSDSNRHGAGWLSPQLASQLGSDSWGQVLFYAFDADAKCEQSHFLIYTRVDAEIRRN